MLNRVVEKGTVRHPQTALFSRRVESEACTQGPKLIELMTESLSSLQSHRVIVMLYSLLSGRMWSLAAEFI